MLVLLQGVVKDKRLRVDGGVSDGFREAEGVFVYSTAVEEGEDLFLYLAASPEAVSSVLVRVDPDGVQKPIYYTSKVLHDAEIRYSRTEIIFALIVFAQRLRPYFQAHPIVVLTDQPLKVILSRPDTSDRLAKWAVKLEEFDLSFRPRLAMKSQVLADFHKVPSLGGLPGRVHLDRRAIGRAPHGTLGCCARTGRRGLDTPCGRCVKLPREWSRPHPCEPGGDGSGVCPPVSLQSH